MKTAQHKVVIVTGGAAGLGRASALRFAEEGARVAVWDVNDPTGSGLLDEMIEAGGEGVYQKVNVADRPRVDRAVADVVMRWGRVDVLINNAGILRDAQLVKWKDGAVVSLMTDDQFDAVIDVNLRGVFTCTRAVVPHMIRQGGGVVLSAASVVAHAGNFGQTNYAAAKAGVINMTRTWSRELGRFNIRVNAVAPGFIATEMVRAMPPKMLDPDGVADADRAHRAAPRRRERVRLARLGGGELRPRCHPLRGRWSRDRHLVARRAQGR